MPRRDLIKGRPSRNWLGRPVAYGGGAENPRLASGDPHSLGGLCPPHASPTDRPLACPLNGSALHRVRFSAIQKGAGHGRQATVTRDHIHGGGAENRTPVQSSPLTGVSRLSHQLDLGRRAPDDSRLAPQLVQSFPRAYQLRPLEHLPRMTRPQRRKQSPVQRLRY